MIYNIKHYLVEIKDSDKTPASERGDYMYLEKEQISDNLVQEFEFTLLSGI